MSGKGRTGSARLGQPKPQEASRPKEFLLSLKDCVHYAALAAQIFV